MKKIFIMGMALMLSGLFVTAQINNEISDKMAIAKEAKRMGNMEDAAEIYEELLKTFSYVPDFYLLLAQFYSEEFAGDKAKSERAVKLLKQYLDLFSDDKNYSSAKTLLGILEYRTGALSKRKPSQNNPNAFRENLQGRWVSDKTGANNRELWIFDISLLPNDEARIEILSQSGISIKFLSSVAEVTSIDANNSVICFGFRSMENYVPDYQKYEDDKYAAPAIGELFNILGDAWGVNLRSTTSMISAVAEDNINRRMAADIPKTKHFLYEFIMEAGETVMAGVLKKVVIEESSAGTKELNNTVEEYVLFKTPADYKGFSYKQINQKEWRNNPAFSNMHESLGSHKRNANAANTLGYLYLNGLGVSSNIIQAEEYFERAASQGNILAMNNLGIINTSNASDFEKAKKWFQKSIDAGDTDALICMGDLYRNLSGNPVYNWTDNTTKTKMVDDNKAMEYYRRAAEKDNILAFHKIGKMYDEGLGVKKDEDIAVYWYKKAADNGSVNSMNAVAQVYQKRGDLQSALYWYEEAAKSGNYDAVDSLAVIHQKNNNIQAVWQCYLQAAEHGNTQAMKMLSYCYKYGVNVEQDYAKAIEWLKRSYETENPRRSTLGKTSPDFSQYGIEQKLSF